MAAMQNFLINVSLLLGCLKFIWWHVTDVVNEVVIELGRVSR